MIHFTSDLHFGHATLAKIRGFDSVTEMDEALIAKWTRRVGFSDEIYVLGDCSFHKKGGFRSILARLPGKKHLILGNHDSEIRHRPKAWITPEAFATVQDYLEIRVPQAKNVKICMFHYGQRVWNESHYGSIQLHGHSHGSLSPHGRSVDVGVDANWITPELRPVSLDEVLAYMSTREPALVDGHGVDRATRCPRCTFEGYQGPHTCGLTS